jgi:hypothetical protein
MTIELEIAAAHIRLLLFRERGRGTSGVASGRQSRRDERGDQHGGALRGEPTSEPGPAF